MTVILRAELKDDKPTLFGNLLVGQGASVEICKCTALGLRARTQGTHYHAW